MSVELTEREQRLAEILMRSARLKAAHKISNEVIKNESITEDQMDSLKSIFGGMILDELDKEGF